VLLQGVLVVLLLSIAAAGIATGDYPVGDAGAWTSALFALYLLFVLLVMQYGRSEPWVAKDQPEDGGEGTGDLRKVSVGRTGQGRRAPGDGRSTGRIVFLTALDAFLILIA
jgi:hypothetical protein